MTATTADGRPILWSPHPKQAQFLACPAFEVLGGGQGGGGKSDCIITAPLRQIHTPGHRALIIRREYPELVELLDRADALYPALGAKYTADPIRYTWSTGAFIQFGHAKDGYRTIRRLYHGQQFNDLGVDELTLFEEEKAWTYLLSRLRTTNRALTVQARATTNPGGPGHAWVKRRFVDKCPDNGQPVRIPLADGSHVTRAFVRFGLDDNPSMTENDPAYKSRLMLLPELDRAQILGGDWSAGGSTYYGELNESVHFVKPFKVPDFWHRFGGHDWGYAHPWASCDVVKNERGEIFVMDTVWGHRQQDEDIAARMLERFPHAARPDYVIRCGGDVFSEHQAKRGDQTYSTKDTYRAAGLTIMRKDDSAGSRKRNAVNLRRLIAYRERGRTRDGRPCDGVPLLRFVDTPGNWWLFNQLLNIVKDPTDNELPLKVDWDDGVDVWPESHDEAPAGDDGADALTAALSLALPTVTVPDNAYGRHEDKAEPMGKRIERRRQEHQAGPVVMLPPPSIASGWDADTYEEIRA